MVALLLLPLLAQQDPTQSSRVGILLQGPVLLLLLRVLQEVCQLYLLLVVVLRCTMKCWRQCTGRRRCSCAVATPTRSGGRMTEFCMAWARCLSCQYAIFLYGVLASCAAHMYNMALPSGLQLAVPSIGFVMS